MAITISVESARLRRMRGIALRLLAGAVGTAVLLDLPFPIAGPLPMWRTVFAWIALVPLVVRVVRLVNGPDCLKAWPLWVLGAGWLSGALWFGLNCYWVYDTMHNYGGMGPVMAGVCLVLFSVYLGFWFGLFTLALGMVSRATKLRGASENWLLGLIPVLWVGMEFAVARIPSFPWDELGYSQIDNALLTRLAPWTGVMGISFALAAGNALLAGGFFLTSRRGRRWSAAAGLCAGLLGMGGFLLRAPRPMAEATAMLVQPNLNVNADDVWVGAQWDAHLAEFARLAGEECGKSFLTGMPETGATEAKTSCGVSETSKALGMPAADVPAPALVAWPESAAPFRGPDPRFQEGMGKIARAEQSPMIVGNVGMEVGRGEDGLAQYRIYNSASVIAANGSFVGRYDKIHLVPFGEYVPARQLLFFAHQLTQQLTDLNGGAERKVFRLRSANGAAHHYGIFICYESVFGDEVRQFVELGAETLVNISDDGWYGDTSAPWEHLNMARMRAIENHRWLLRDTNSGVTASIDPNGVVRQSIERHRVDVLPAQFGYETRLTWYTVHGDVLGMICAILAVVFALWAARALLWRRRVEGSV